jgi:enamine deaminase RidA (YjgF/YER057c/UK114 family)
MNSKFEVIHTITKDELLHNPQWNMPYVPAIRVLSGNPVYISGVNAAPIYHSHPHEADEFHALDFSPEGQAKATMKNLIAILDASGGVLSDVVQLFVFIVDAQKHGDRIGEVVSDYFGGHLCSSTVVGVTDLLTDSRLILEITAVAYI